jgi:uncharacterized protein Veg
MTLPERTIFNYQEGIRIQRGKIAELKAEVKMRLGEIVKMQAKIKKLKAAK